MQVIFAIRKGVTGTNNVLMGVKWTIVGWIAPAPLEQWILKNTFILCKFNTKEEKFLGATPSS